MGGRPASSTRWGGFDIRNPPGRKFVKRERQIPNGTGLLNASGLSILTFARVFSATGGERQNRAAGSGLQRANLPRLRCRSRWGECVGYRFEELLLDIAQVAMHIYEQETG